MRIARIFFDFRHQPRHKSNDNMASLKSAVKRVINIEHISRLFTDENEELYGNFTYLCSIDNFRNVFSRHQLRKHLQKRGEEDTGSKRKLCERLKLSVQREKEQRAKESEEAKAAFHQAKSMEEAGSGRYFTH